MLALERTRGGEPPNHRLQPPGVVRGSRLEGCTHRRASKGEEITNVKVAWWSFFGLAQGNFENRGHFKCCVGNPKRSSRETSW
jgi:hypothetical protein